MAALLTIGDFSRMTYLSRKALRHYHEIGLLEPAGVDAASGYRMYAPAQVPIAQVIRRLRELDMPLESIREVLAAPDAAMRNDVIVAHLRRMERQLGQLQGTVSSLRGLLEQQPGPVEISYRTAPSTTVLAITEQVAMADIQAWGLEVFATLRAAVPATGGGRTGPDGALYSGTFFEEGSGPVTAFIPISPRVEVVGRPVVVELPETELAVSVHAGPFGELDQTYGALGRFVAAHAIGLDGPIRENYLVSEFETDDETAHRTEVCWPVFRTASADGSEG